MTFPALTYFGFFPFGFGAYSSMGAIAWPITYGGPSPVDACRKIRDGDYVLDSDGQYVDAESPVGQEAEARIATVAGTFVDPAFGNKLLTIQVRTDASASLAQTYNQAALQPMVDAGTIANLAIVSTFETINGTSVSENDIRYDATGVYQAPVG